MEEEINSKRIKTLELWCDSVRLSGIEWRALSRILRIQLQQMVDICGSSVREVVGRHICVHFFVRSGARS